MAWDIKPNLLKNKAVAKSSLVLLGSSIVTTILAEHLISKEK